MQLVENKWTRIEEPRVGSKKHRKSKMKQKKTSLSPIENCGQAVRTLPVKVDTCQSNVKEDI